MTEWEGTSKLSQSDAEQQTVPATTADVAEVVLTKEDVPDPTLQSRQPDELKYQSWLACQGASRTGLKP